MHTSLRKPACALLIGLLVSAEAMAEESWKKDRFMVGVGLYRPGFDTRIRVDDPETGVSGTLLNLEKDLSLSERDTQVTFDAHYRFAKRHAVEFEYVKLSRKNETSVGFVIDYDGDVIAINEELETTFRTEVARLGYRYSFINSDRMELSGSFGLHVTDLKVGLNVVGDAPEFNDVTAPLPTLGAAWKYRFNDQWSFHVRGEWLDIKVNDVRGSLTSGVAEVTWFPFRNLGASIGYNVWDLGVKVSKSSLTGKIDYRYDGPKLTIRARF